MTLRDRVRNEWIDDNWALKAENELKRIYVPLLGIEEISVLCGSTMCEVTGEIVPEKAPAAAELLQGAAITNAVKAAGFKARLGFRVSVDPEKGGKTSFASYWARDYAAR